MTDFLMLLNLPVFSYGIMAVLLNWYLKKDIIVADVFTAFSIIVFTVWSTGFVIAVCGGIYTFLACYYRNQITLWFKTKFKG